MNTLPAFLLEWIARPEASSDYACDGAPGRCRAYHVTSPVLHHIGHFRSYEWSSAAIITAVESARRRGGAPSILVSGLANEYSAAALSDAVWGAAGDAHIAFFDICETPLRRTARHMAAKGSGKVELRRVDILEGLPPDWVGRFDVIVMDSFLKQFPLDVKPLVLRNVLVASAIGGTIVTRDYAGDLASLMESFWQQRLSRLAHFSIPPAVAPSLDRWMEQTYEYMIQSGTTCPSQEDNRRLLEEAGMAIETWAQPPGKPFAIALGHVIGRPR